MIKITHKCLKKGVNNVNSVYSKCCKMSVNAVNNVKAVYCSQLFTSKIFYFLMIQLIINKLLTIYYTHYSHYSHFLLCQMRIPTHTHYLYRKIHGNGGNGGFKEEIVIL